MAIQSYVLNALHPALTPAAFPTTWNSSGRFNSYKFADKN